MQKSFNGTDRFEWSKQENNERSYEEQNVASEYRQYGITIKYNILPLDYIGELFAILPALKHNKLRKSINNMEKDNMSICYYYFKGLSDKNRKLILSSLLLFFVFLLTFHGSFALKNILNSDRKRYLQVLSYTCKEKAFLVILANFF